MNPLSNAWPIEILLVEDNPGDVDLTREALEQAKVCNHLHVVDDGAKAVDFLFQRGAYAAAPRPDLILLDLNLPKKDGRQVLAEIKTEPRLAAIPVVVLTTSEAEEDICRAYALHANCYITKPVNLKRFLDVVRAIEDFWLFVVKLPHNPAPLAPPETSRRTPLDPPEASRHAERDEYGQLPEVRGPGDE